MIIVSENQFSGKTYFYTIGPLQTVKILSVYESASIFCSSSGNITYSWMVGWNEDSRLTCGERLLGQVEYYLVTHIINWSQSNV